MVPWEWKRTKASPSDVLDAARTIRANNNWVTANLTDGQITPDRYLAWAKSAIGRGGDEGWDSATTYAKRAVCCRMDGILTHNHLVSFLNKKNNEKSELLTQLQVPGLNVLRHSVIDPRNGIEHEYRAATEVEARRACEVAELFLLATAKEAAITAIVTLGWNADYRGEISAKPGEEFERHQFGLAHHHAPMLIIDHYTAMPEVLVLNPKDESLQTCPLKEFSSDQVIALNKQMRECLNRSSGGSGSYSFYTRQYNQPMWARVQEQLKLTAAA